MEDQNTASISDANYRIIPKEEMLDDLEITHERDDHEDFIVPEKELSNATLHIDTTVLDQHIDIPIKIEIEEDTTICNADYLIEPKEEMLDDPEDDLDDVQDLIVPKEELSDTSLYLETADLDQPMTKIVTPIKTETILSKEIAELQTDHNSSEDTELTFCDADVSSVHMKTQYDQQEPSQPEASLYTSQPVNDKQPVTSSTMNPPSHNIGNLECENIHTSAKHTKTREKTNFCKHCPYKCVKPSHMKTHMMRHTGEKPYHCDQCNYRCSKTSALKYHMRTHTGEKPYQCNQCDFKFTMSSALKNHMRTHTGEKPYNCKHCDYKSSTAGALKYHMRTHTGEKPYSCEHCDYKCTNSSHLKAHMRTHTGEKRYHCEQCDYKCSKQSYLKTHMTTHTGYHCMQCDYKTMAISAFKYHTKSHIVEKPL